MSIKIEKSNQNEFESEQQRQLEALQAEQDLALRNAGIADKVKQVYRAHSETIARVAAERHIPLPDGQGLTPDIDDPNITLVVGRLDRKARNADPNLGAVVLTQLSVLSRTKTLDAAGNTMHVVSHPVSVAESYEGSVMAVSPFNNEDVTVVDGLLGEVEQTITGISANLLRLLPANSSDTKG